LSEANNSGQFPFIESHNGIYDIVVVLEVKNEQGGVKRFRDVDAIGYPRGSNARETCQVTKAFCYFS